MFSRRYVNWHKSEKNKHVLKNVEENSDEYNGGDLKKSNATRNAGSFNYEYYRCRRFGHKASESKTRKI